VKNYRDKIYKHYTSNSGKNLSPMTVDGFKPRKPLLNKIIVDLFPKNKDISILEIGCGYGAFGYFIQKAGYTRYIGIDGSEEQVAEARRLNIKNIILGDLVEYLETLAENSLDLLIALDVIEHFNKEELSDLIDLFHHVLKKDGLIITHQPNAEGPFGNAIRHGDFTHELAFTRASISQIFLSSGFSKVESYEDAPIPHGIKSTIRLFLWCYFVKPCYKFLLMVEDGRLEKNIILSKNFLSVIRK
jgi:SAM-dependent methyltransferase